MADAACLACDVVAGRITPPGGVIFDDGLWQVDHALSPAFLRGWLIVKPRRHVEHFSDLAAEEAVRYGPVLGATVRALREALRPERVYACSFGESVHHLHVHLVPRYAELPPDGPELLPRLFADDRPFGCADEEAAQAAAAVRAAFEAYE